MHHQKTYHPERNEVEPKDLGTQLLHSSLETAKLLRLARLPQNDMEVRAKGILQ